MARMLNVGNIIGLVIDRLTQGTCAQKDFLSKTQQALSHIASDGGKQFETVLHEVDKQRLRKIAFVTEQTSPSYAGSVRGQVYDHPGCPARA